jgi:hypothetical protein
MDKLLSKLVSLILSVTLTGLDINESVIFYATDHETTKTFWGVIDTNLGVIFATICVSSVKT